MTLIVPGKLDDQHPTVGKELMLVGRLKPVARISFWNELALVTFTGTAADSVELPDASAPARSTCAHRSRPSRVPRQRVRRGGVLDSDVDTVDEELHTSDTDVVVRVRGDVHDVAHLRVVAGEVIATVGAVESPAPPATGVFMSVWISAG